MRRLAMTFAATMSVTAMLAAPVAAAPPEDMLPQEWLGELADARNLLASLKENGTPAMPCARRKTRWNVGRRQGLTPSLAATNSSPASLIPAMPPPPASPSRKPRRQWGQAP